MHVSDSDRLCFRLFDPAIDAPNLFELDRDPEVMRFITRGETQSLAGIHSQSIPRIQKYQDPDQGWGIWMVHRRTDGKFLGWILVRPMGFFEGNSDPSNLELGWRFTRSSWGNGYATEAARAVMHRLIEAGQKKFSAHAMASNEGSVAVMKKIGMHFKAHESLEVAGKVEEIVVYERVLEDS